MINKLLKIILTIVLVSLIILSSIGLGCSIVDAFKYDFLFSQKGFNTFLNIFTPYSYLYASTFIVISAYLALQSLFNKKDIDEGKALLDIRLLLERYNDIHQNFRGEYGAWIDGVPDFEDKIKGNETWARIDAYLGIFELCGILIEKGTISMDNFKSQFGYKLKNAMNVKNVREKIENEASSWKELYKLANRMKIN